MSSKTVFSLRIYFLCKFFRDYFLDNTFKYFVNKLKLNSTSLMGFQLNFNKNKITTNSL